MRLPTVNQIKMQMSFMGDQYDMVNRLQTQITTGKKLLHSSDDPFLANKIKSTDSYLSELKSYEYNSILAENMNNAKDTLGKQTISLIQTTQQLLIQAENETLNDVDRMAIANQIDGILSQLLSIANATDDTGEHIFAGMNANTIPFSYQNGKYVYQGSNETKQIDISSNLRVNYTESGYQVFGNIFNGNGTLTATSNIGVNTGTGVINGFEISNLSQYVRDSYTINMVTNSANELAYVVTGALSGQVLPPLPGSIPADAPAFPADGNINFNGINMVISGQPTVGDSFTIAPSQQQDLFTTFQNLSSALKVPVTSDTDKANMRQQLINVGLCLDQANTHFQNFQITIGNDGTNIDTQKLISQNLILDEKLILSRLSDADMPTLISDLTRQLTIVQLTQDTYLKVQETFYNLLGKYT